MISYPCPFLRPLSNLYYSLGLGLGLQLGFQPPSPPPLDLVEGRARVFSRMNGSTSESLIKRDWRLKEWEENEKEMPAPQGFITPSLGLQQEPMAPIRHSNEGTLQTGAATAFSRKEKFIEGPVDLNTSSHTPKNLGQLRGHVASPVQESEAMRKWKEIKQNGFLSHPNGGVPIPPPQPSKKSKRKEKGTDAKKKIDITIGEQVIKFKNAPCSGLLSRVSTGIIRRVKDHEEVHAILEAMVRLEKKSEGQLQNEESKDRQAEHIRKF